MRKTILIPTLILGRPPGYHVLELLIEPNGFSLGGQPHCYVLNGHKLKTALAAVKKVTAVRSIWALLPHRSPVLYLSNPLPGSHMLNVTIGIAMGLLMYQGLCACDRLMVTGQLTGSTIETTADLTHVLTAAKTLGYQQTPLPFIVPALAQPNTYITRRCATLIRGLATLNIHIFPAQNLREALMISSVILGGENNLWRSDIGF